jgi:hypothetical protein
MDIKNGKTTLKFDVSPKVEPIKNPKAVGEGRVDLKELDLPHVTEGLFAAACPFADAIKNPRPRLKGKRPGGSTKIVQGWITPEEHAKLKKIHVPVSAIVRMFLGMVYGR